METTKEIINGKSRIVATVEITYNGKVEKVKIKKLNFGEYNELQRASMKMTMLGNVPKLEMDAVAMNEFAVLKSVIDAPFPINDMTVIRELDREIAEAILGAVNELNMPNEKKNIN